jgi:hypothetical protein
MISHDQAGYQEHGSSDEHCLNCDMYREPNLCMLVEDILWYGWCEYWEEEDG